MRSRNLILLLIIILLISGWWWLKKPSPANPPSASLTPSPSQAPSNQKPTIVSSIPPYGQDEPPILLPTQNIEITFNMPLENTGEVKYQIDPKMEYSLKLSNDRQTVTFIAKSSYKLGTNYTLSIKPDTKFNINPGKNETKIISDQTFDLHFKTLTYRGI